MIHLLGAALHEISLVVAPLLVASIWQGVAIAGTVTLLLRVLPRISARHLCQLWFSALLLCALLPLVVWGLRSLWTTVPANSDASVAATPAFLVLDPLWSLLCTIGWLLAILVTFIRLASGLWGVRRLLKVADPVPESLRLTHTDWLGATKRGDVILLISDEINTPVATGFFKPCIVLPRDLLNRLSADDMKQVLQHESAHLSRMDDWMALVTRVILVVFPLSPAVHYIEAQIARTREVACDDAVLTATTSARSYAGCLVRIAESTYRRASNHLMAGFSGDSSQLASRIDHILKFSVCDTRRSSRIALATTAFCMAALFSTLLASPDFVSFASVRITPTQHALNVAAPVLPISKLSTVAKETHQTHLNKPVQHAIMHRAKPQTAVPRQVASVTDASVLNSEGQPEPMLLVLWDRHIDGSAHALVLVLASTSSSRSDRQSFTLFHI